MKVARLLFLLSPFGLGLAMIVLNRALRERPDLSDRVCMVPEAVQMFACIMGGLALNIALVAIVAGSPGSLQLVLKCQVAALGIAPLVALYSRAVLGE